jgi:hypothetical protein
LEAKLFSEDSKKQQKCTSTLDISLRDRISPADPERFCRYPQYGRRLPAFVFVEFDSLYHPPHDFRIKSSGYYLLYRQAALDISR